MLSGRSPVRLRYSPQKLCLYVQSFFYEMNHCIYILYSIKSDRYYVGCTSDIEARIIQHNSGRNASTKFGLPWQLKYTEPFESLSEARLREIEIKKKSRKYIEWLINKPN